MKKLFFILSLILAGNEMFAGPADPSPHEYIQPDGSKVTFFIHGDEYLNWMTDANGNAIERGSDGFFHQCSKPSDAEYEKAARMRSMAVRPSMAESRGLTGEKKFCVIMVQFSDVKFTKTKAQIEKMFNGTGSESGSTGSVKEYWTDQSDGTFIPTFDVYGPYTMDNTISTYDTKSGGSTSTLMYQVINNFADGDIDFSAYKHKSSGVESVIMVFAGYSAAMGASPAIWPHQGSVSCYVDGVNINSFCCVPELQGTSGTTIAGIGHVCHEFGHCLGLPDIYDTDRSSHESTAKAPVYHYSVMDHGNYTNNSKTPPPLSILEKYLCGWVSNLTSGSNGEIVTLTSSGAKTLYEIGQSGSNPRALRINTQSNSSEFFICEFRSNNSSVNKWGSQLPKAGMIVYHVDRRTGHWTSDSSVGMNTDPDHPDLYLVNASDQFSIPLYSKRDDTDWASFPFPGNGNVSSYNPTSWDGVDTYVSLTGMPNVGASSTNTSISVKANVRNFPLINNPKKGVYSAGDTFTFELSPGYSQGSISVTSWYFDGKSVSDSDSVTLTSGSHTVEAVLSNARKLKLEIVVK